MIDYRLANAVTVRDNYPLPRMDDILDNLGKARSSPLLIARTGTTRSLHPDSIPKSAFSTLSGLYEYLVCPQGVTSAPRDLAAPLQ